MKRFLPAFVLSAAGAAALVFAFGGPSAFADAVVSPFYNPVSVQPVPATVTAETPSFQKLGQTLTVPALTNQRFALLQPDTLTAASSVTVTNAATLAVAAPPVAGSNVTITNDMALWVPAGAVNLGECTVTQATSATTGVTCNGASLVITTFSESAAANASAAFTVTDNAVLAGSSVQCMNGDYSGTYHTNGIPYLDVNTVAAGSFKITVVNIDQTNALSGTLKLKCVVD